MAQVIKLNSYAAPVSIPCTLASLGSSTATGQQAAAVDNSANLFLDCLLTVRAKLGAGTLGTDPTVYVYVAGAIDAVTNWPDVVTGSDGAITPDSFSNLRLAGTLTYSAQSQSQTSEPISIASLFGGIVPRQWAVIVLNSSGIALSATATDHLMQYTGMTAQAV